MLNGERYNPYVHSGHPYLNIQNVNISNTNTNLQSNMATFNSLLLD